MPLILDTHDSIYHAHDITFGRLTHLNAIGFVTFSVAHHQRLHLPKQVAVSYYGQEIGIEFPKENDNSLNLGRVLLTKVGRELAPICGSQPVEGFVDYVKTKWEQVPGCKVTRLD